MSIYCSVLFWIYFLSIILCFITLSIDTRIAMKKIKKFNPNFKLPKRYSFSDFVYVFVPMFIPAVNTLIWCSNIIFQKTIVDIAVRKSFDEARDIEEDKTRL